MAPSDGSRNHVWLWMIAVVSLLIHESQSAQVAKGQYFMDRRDDCSFVGKLDVARDKTTFVIARSSTSPPSPQLSCTLQFGPQTRGDTLKMGFESGTYIASNDVSLNVQMSDNQVFQMTSQPGGEPPKLESRDGLLRINLNRRSYSSSDYGFRIWVRAERSVASDDGSGSGSDIGTGAIVGIVAGVIVLVVLFSVLCVCCYLRSKRSDKIQGNAIQVTQNYEIKAQLNGVRNTSVEESPASDRRLLVRNENTESLQGKTALDRFGPVEPRKTRQARDDYSDTDVEVGRPDRFRQQKSRQEEEGARRSPLLSDLHRNPKFRQSFHENEVDAHDRVKRVSYTSEDSSASLNSRGVPLPPKLPPVPKSPPRSPSPHRRGEKIAMVSRDRPLSSSSDLARQLDENATPDELSDEEPRRAKKADTRHVLRPNRGEKKSRRDDDDDSEEERRRRRKEKERRERSRREEEEDEEEERRRRRKEERRRREEEEEETDRRHRQRERDQDDDGREREGRFKKSASGRKSKGKGPRKGRSKSTGNALDEMEDNYQRSRSKSPSSVRSLNFIEVDDDDLDSNYMPFKRSGSKTSLYASRSSLYGRRRKNSMGETISLSSYAYDDVDSRYGDFDRKGLSRKDRDRMFKSTGELEMHTATAQVVRECATQTGTEKAVHIYGRKTIAKMRPGRMYSRGTQTGFGRDRRDSTGSARSGRSGRSSRSHNRLKHKSKSQESLRKVRKSRSRNLDDDSDDSDDRRSRKSRSRSRNLDYTDDDDESCSGRRNKHHRSKSRGLDDDDDDGQSSRGGRHRPRARPRKSTGAASVDLSDSDVGSVAASSIAASMAHPPPMQPNPYGGQFVPVAYPAGPMAYLPTAPGGPPMVQVLPGGVRPQVGPKPAVAPKPQKSKWDTLVEITDGEKQRQRRMGDSPTETESMFSSAYGHPPANGANGRNVYAPPSYTTAQRYPNPNSTISSNYPDSSGQPHSARGPRDYKLDSYTPSESMI